MSIENSKLVLSYAAAHSSFRYALRSDPHATLERFSKQLGLSKDGLEIEELDALVSFSDDDYTTFKKIIEGLGDSLSAEVNGGVIF